jgi:hypothetical protein
MTIQLHVVSQGIDAMTANAEMQSMIVRKLMAGHERYRHDTHSLITTDTLTGTSDALQYLADSIESQRRWLLSYKARKDIAMNLVSKALQQLSRIIGTEVHGLTSLGLQPCDTTGCIYEHYDSTCSKSRWQLYEGHRGPDNGFSPGHVPFLGIWDGHDQR